MLGKRSPRSLGLHILLFVFAQVVGLGLLTVLLPAAAFAGAPSDDLESQAVAIARELMCPVCEGQTVADSNSALAAQMRQIIREKLKEGKTRQEILDYFVAQFGDSVLATPPRRSLALILWVAPFSILTLGLALAILVMWRWTKSRSTASSPTVDPEQRKRLEEELKRQE